MKKTLAITLVLVMVVSCLSVLFVSAAEVESLTVHFTQLEGTSTNDCSLTLFSAGESDLDLKSGDANIRWAYAIAVDANGKIVRLGKNLLSEAQDANNEYDYHSILIPAGGHAIVFHCGDGENSSGNEDLRDYFTDLLAATGHEGTDCDNTVLDVSAAGWQIANLTTEGGEFDYGSVTLYKGAAPAGEGDTSDEPQEPQVVVVEEVVTVDGELNDTGWNKAEWIDNGFWQGVQDGEYPGDDVTGKYAVRADEEKIYIALEMNTIAPNTTDAYDANSFVQASASNIRIWFKKDAENRTFFDLQYNGTEFVLANWNTTHDAVKDNTQFVVNYADGKVVAEVAVSIEDLGIEDSFYLLVTYSETYETGYNAIHFTTAETLNDPEGGDNANYWAVGNTYSYTEYTVEDLLLGTYEEVTNPGTDEPEPEDTYEQDIAAMVGEELEDPDFAIDLDSSIEEVDGKNVMTVTLSVKDIKEGVKMQALIATLHYDTERLTLLTQEIEKESDGSIVLDCETTIPGASWENLTKEILDDDGNITGDIGVRFTGMNPNQIISDETPILLTFQFELKEGFDKAGVYVATESVSSIYAPNDGTSTTIAYAGNGAYTVATVVSAEVPSDSTTTESTGTTPGDSGVLMFAILGILAIAGAAVVVKVRN